MNQSAPNLEVRRLQIFHIRSAYSRGFGPRRVALLGRQHNHDRAKLHAVEEVDHVFIRQPNATGRDGLADILGLVRAVDPEQGVLIALVEIDASRAQRIMWPAFDKVGEIAKPLLDVSGWYPRRPFFLPADLGDSIEQERIFANRHAIAYGLLVRQHI